MASVAMFSPDEHRVFQEALDKYGESALTGDGWQSIVTHCDKSEVEVRFRMDRYDTVCFRSFSRNR